MLDQLHTRYWFYVLYSLKDHKLYKGICLDIGARFLGHNLGASPSTRHRRPLVLIYVKAFESKQEALRYERYTKTLEGGTALYSLLKEGGVLSQLKTSCEEG